MSEITEVVLSWRMAVSKRTWLHICNARLRKFHYLTLARYDDAVFPTQAASYGQEKVAENSHLGRLFSKTFPKKLVFTAPPLSIRKISEICTPEAVI